MPLIVSRYVCSAEGVWSGSATVISWSSDSSPSSTYRSTGGRSESSLPASEWQLEALSFLCRRKWGELVLVDTEDLGRWVWDQWDTSWLVDWCLGAEESVPVRSEAWGRCRSDGSWLDDWCLIAEESEPVRFCDVSGWGRSEVSWLVDWCLTVEKSDTVHLGEDSCSGRSDLSWLEGWCNKADEPNPVRSEDVVEDSVLSWLADWCIAEESWPVRSVEVGWKKGSVSLLMVEGGEWVGVTLTADEKVSGKDLDMRSASKRLNLSDHFLSNSSIFLSVDLSTVFLDLVTDFFPFLTFFLCTDSGGEDTETLSLTAPITDTVDGSTKVPSLEGDDSSAFLAPRFSFLSL